MNRGDFDSMLDIVVQSQQWRVGETLKDFWFSVAANGLDSGDFARVVMAFADTPNQKPADFFSEVKKAVRRVNAPAPAPAVAPTPHSDEAIRCRKGEAAMVAARANGCPYGGCKSGGDYGNHHCYCFSEAWAEPITDEDRRAPAVNPVALALGGVPAPDPKEGDLVWR
jgi:hypothetical protein